MNKKDELLRKKKKLLAFSMATVLGLTSISGCSSGFDYQQTEDGKVIVEGVISSYDLEKAKLVHLTNEVSGIDEYILVLQYYSRVQNYYSNIETGVTVYNEDNDYYKNFKMEIILEHMVDFLYKYNMVKDKYSIEDVQKLKELLLTDEKLNITNTESSINILKKTKDFC